MKLDNILNESREWRRIDVNIAAQVKSLELPGGSFPSQVVNINPDGLCFIVPDRVKPGQELRLILELPAIGKMEARVNVVWAGYFEQSKSFRAGGKFIALPPKEKEKFLRFYHLKAISLGGG